MMMPVELKIILTIILCVAMFGGLIYAGIQIIKHPEEWIFWKKEYWDSIQEFEDD